MLLDSHRGKLLISAAFKNSLSAGNWCPPGWGYHHWGGIHRFRDCEVSPGEGFTIAASLSEKDKNGFAGLCCGGADRWVPEILP